MHNYNSWHLQHTFSNTFSLHQQQKGKKRKKIWCNFLKLPSSKIVGVCLSHQKPQDRHEQRKRESKCSPRCKIILITIIIIITILCTVFSCFVPTMKKKKRDRTSRIAQHKSCRNITEVLHDSFSLLHIQQRFSPHYGKLQYQTFH